MPVPVHDVLHLLLVAHEALGEGVTLGISLLLGRRGGRKRGVQRVISRVFIVRVPREEFPWVYPEVVNDVPFFS